MPKRFLNICCLIWLLTACVGPVPEPPAPGTLRVTGPDTMIVELALTESDLRSHLAQSGQVVDGSDGQRFTFQKEAIFVAVTLEEVSDQLTRLIFRGVGANGEIPPPEFLGTFCRSLLQGYLK